MPNILLDTCAVIFIANGDPISPASQNAVTKAATNGTILVSPVSAWEIGLLAAKKGITFLPDPKTWFQTFMTNDGVQLAPLTPEAAVDSSFLPAPLHADPADRLLITTARILNVPLVTRDRSLLTYAAAGHIKAIPC